MRQVAGPIALLDWSHKTTWSRATNRAV